MHYFFTQPNEIVTRLELVDYLWNNKIHINDNTLSINVTLIFLLPLLPAFMISGSFVYIIALKMRSAVFHFNAMDNHLWIVRTLGISYIFFILLYGIYYIAVQEASIRRS